MALEHELATYKREFPALLSCEGKHVLIHKDSVIDVFGTYEDAIKDGYHRFKLEPFLVKTVAAIEQAQFVSRLLPCR